MSVMRFNGALNVDMGKWAHLKMLRDDHTSRPKAEPVFTDNQADMPKFGAGSEYGREAREEARRRKYGQHKKKINAEDHPWVLKAVTADKQTKRFKGVREGTISSNASYFIFTQATDGQFEVFPVSQWYNFTPIQTYKSLSAEEAEEEFGRRNKILNYFSVMVRKRMKGDEADGGEKEEESSSKKKGGGGGLKVSEMEDWDDINEMESDDDEEQEDKKEPKKKKKDTKKKKQKGSDSEGNEDSDDGDGEGREVDYFSDSSITESEDEESKKVELGGVDQETGLRNLLESDSSEEENPEEKKKEEEEPEEAEKPKKKGKKKKKKPSSEAQPAESLSDESDDDEPDGGNDTDEPEKSPAPEKEKTPDVDEAESRKRKAAKAVAGAQQAAKKPKMEISPALLQTAASEGITEEAVRRYLTRKPMTVTELLQKFKSKKTKVSSKDMVTIIASILKKINPAKRMQNTKMYLYLKN
jgi:transcription initiation factor TFIIF subunit alpha